MLPSESLAVAARLADQFIILSLQALLAAVFEERFALRGDGNGFRNRHGEFVSKRHALVRVFLGVGGIAFAVTVVPPVADALFVDLLVQGTGAGILLTVILIHIIVDDWTIREVEYTPLAIGGLLVVAPYLAPLV